VKIAQVDSHVNGLEFLMVRRPGIWTEIEAVIRKVDARACKAKGSREKRSSGRMFYSPVAMNAAFKAKLRARHWNESRVSYWVTKSEKPIRKTLNLAPEEQKAETEAASEEPIFSHDPTDFVEHRVAIEVQFGKYSFVADDLFDRHLAFCVRDEIDVGVEILPMKSLQTEMIPGVARYEGEFYHVIRQGRGVPAVPLVLVGIEANTKAR
jgi:hypothetical protein